jgi:hypothetical protein
MVKKKILNFIGVAREIDTKTFLHLSLWEHNFKQRPHNMC